MRPVLIITHLDDHAAGLAREELERAGCPVIEANALDGARLPAPAEISAIVSLGGEMSATDYERQPFLSAEVALMRAALADQTPVLGMCLGAQLLAVAGGGRVSTLDRVYVGWPELSPLASAAGDPLFGDFAPDVPVLKWHEDVIDPPPGAVVLGTTPSPGRPCSELAAPPGAARPTSRSPSRWCSTAGSPTAAVSTRSGRPATTWSVCGQTADGGCPVRWQPPGPSSSRSPSSLGSSYLRWTRIVRELLLVLCWTLSEISALALKCLCDLT